MARMNDVLRILITTSALRVAIVTGARRVDVVVHITVVLVGLSLGMIVTIDACEDGRIIEL